MMASDFMAAPDLNATSPSLPPYDGHDLCVVRKEIVDSTLSVIPAVGVGTHLLETAIDDPELGSTGTVVDSRGPNIRLDGGVGATYDVAPLAVSKVKNICRYMITWIGSVCWHSNAWRKRLPRSVGVQLRGVANRSSYSNNVGESVWSGATAPAEVCFSPS